MHVICLTIHLKVHDFLLQISHIFGNILTLNKSILFKILNDVIRILIILIS